MRQKKQSALQRFAVKFFTPSNLLLALLWVIWLGIAVYVQTHAQEHVVFDPFEILQVRRSCCMLQLRSRAAQQCGAAECSLSCRLAALRACAVSDLRPQCPGLRLLLRRWSVGRATRISGALTGGSHSSTTRCGPRPALPAGYSVLFMMPHHLWTVPGSLAYREIHLQDKNPDPAASKYFAEYLQKAYKALTGAWPRLLLPAAHRHACGS